MPSPLRTYAGYLLSSVLAVMLALPVAGLVGAAGVVGSEWIGSAMATGLGEIGTLLLLVAFFAVIAGGPAALLFGAPLYALLAWKGWARWWSVLLLVLPPAVAAGWRDPETAGWFVLFGTITALMAHMLHSRTRLGCLGKPAATSKPGQAG